LATRERARGTPRSSLGSVVNRCTPWQPRLPGAETAVAAPAQQNPGFLWWWAHE